MGATCCQGRAKSQSTPTLLPGKTLKRKHRPDIQRRRTRSKEDISKRKAQDLVLTSFSSLFQRIASKPTTPLPVREEGSAQNYLRSESVHLDQHTTQVSSLATPMQFTIKDLMLDASELPISIFPGTYARTSRLARKCQMVVSTLRLYFLDGNQREDAISLLDIAVLCLHLKTHTSLLYLCLPDPDQVTVTSPELSELLKALQFLSYQTHRSFIPVAAFREMQDLTQFAAELTLSDINALHSMETLKAQEAILTSGGDIDESLSLIQPCTYLSEARQFLLSNRRFYVLSKDYAVVLKRTWSEVWNVSRDAECTVLAGKDWRVELGMADCSSAINAARSSL